jgi:hypothetical protein
MAKPKAPPVVETLERVDLDEDFSDVDGDLSNQFALKDPSPDRKYVWVHNDPQSIGLYKGDVRHYEVVYGQHDTARSVADAGIKDGEAVTMMDHVLMSCDRARADKRERFERLTNSNERKKLFRNAQGDTRLHRDDNGRWSRQEARG